MGIRMGCLMLALVLIFALLLMLFAAIGPKATGLCRRVVTCKDIQDVASIEENIKTGIVFDPFL